MITDTHPERIVAIIVTHFPDANTQARLLSSLAPQVDKIVVVANSPSKPNPMTLPLTKLSPRDDIFYDLDNGNHQGLAGGFNLGIRYALDELKADYVYLSDQDSVPAPGLVTRLLLQHKHLHKANSGLVGSIGPSHSYINDRFTGLPASDPTQVTDIISSGSLISRDTINAVGNMDEQLFIDYIDTEWCYRASSRGYTHWVIPGEQLEHNLGNSAVTVLGASKPLHSSADRHYYIIRNSLYLWRKAHMPWRWKLRDMLKFTRRLVAYPLLSSNKGLHLKAVVDGIRDGVMQRMGER